MVVLTPIYKSIDGNNDWDSCSPRRHHAHQTNTTTSIILTRQTPPRPSWSPDKHHYVHHPHKTNTATSIMLTRQTSLRPSSSQGKHRHVHYDHETSITASVVLGRETPVNPRGQPQQSPCGSWFWRCPTELAGGRQLRCGHVDRVWSGPLFGANVDITVYICKTSAADH